MPSNFRRFAHLTLLTFATGCPGDTTSVDGGGSGDSGSTSVGTMPTTGAMTVADSTNDGTASQGGSADQADSDTAVVDDTASDDGTTGGEDTSDSGDTGSTDGSGTDGGTPCDDNGDCDDLQHCNGVETCGASGFCVAGTDPDCDDGVDCTTDACDEVADMCVNVATNAACSDGMFCNGAETCDPIAGCQAGTAPNCADAIPCTMDSCSDAAGACVHTPDDTVCDNGEFCDGAEVCSAATGCGPGPAVDCDDLTACTADSCDEVGDTCVNAPNDALCDNGEQCDGAETCMSGLGCVDGSDVVCPDDGNACTEETCSEASTDDPPCVTNYNNATCVMMGLDFCTDAGCVAGDPCDDDTDCDDLDACNGIETCDTSTVPGVCQSGAPPSCDDMVACTTDACMSTGVNTFTCSNNPVNSVCSDGNPCNGAETCNPASGCQAGPAPNCDDGVGCTTDFCLPAAGCVHPPDSTSCDDGDVCNGPEICDALLDCQPGTPLVCPDDGFACTQETCNSAVGGCVTSTDDSVCDCGLYCDPSGTSVDANGCTDDCSIALCDGTLWECGNCLDDDDDCDIDSGDLNCFGVCDNNESGFDGDIPGQNSAPCKMDCYFDDDSGSGNDDCHWSHACDPLEPQPYQCECTPEMGEMFCDANIPGTSADCNEAWATQSQECEDVCGPIVPNGCDCFGCCEITLPDLTQTTIFLGSEEPNGTPSCNIDVVDDPLLCKPCTQVQACLNTCEPCELCFGETELPPECGGVPECEGEIEPCGVPGLPLCPFGQYCLTGCCTAF